MNWTSRRGLISLPEKLEPKIAVPPWPKFLRGCIRYREALDPEAPDAPAEESEFE